MEAVLRISGSRVTGEKRWKLSLVLLVVVIQLASGNSANCWNNDSECLVHATLHKTASAEQNEGRETLPFDVDCETSYMNSSIEPVAHVTPPPEYLLKRFERAYALTLNGCHKGLKWPTFGLEFLPNCDKVTELDVERFHADVLYALRCPSATFMQVEVLRFERNDIATITVDALANLALLRELYFFGNSLRHIERGAFDGLHFVEHIHLKDESLLALKESSIFEHTNVVDLLMVRLKHVTSELFEKLPQTLREIHAEQISIGVSAKNVLDSPDKQENGIVNINNPQLLRNVTIIGCGLSAFKLNDDHDSVSFLNLSGNLLTDFQITKNGSAGTISELKVLDLSSNRLTHLPLQWLQGLVKLETLNLRWNLLKQLPLIPLLSSIPVVQSIDLRSNKLETLSKVTNNLKSESLYQMHIRMNENPWNCMWLLDFAHNHPEKFRIFQYEKFLSQINVNGLECVPVEKIPLDGHFEGATGISTTEANVLVTVIDGNDTTVKKLNISTLVYGSPWEIKRNQRAEALIIVFMLPVGIAVLFLFLYLWIYCQKIFHLSYYRNCRLFRRKRHIVRGIGVGHRFDVIRQLPPNSTMASLNNNDGYEVPLNGVSPACNCVHSNNNLANNTCNTSNDKCQKLHHITYVPLPDEQAQKIYEEIIGSGEDNCAADDPKLNSPHPIYDHLTFE